MANQDNNGNNHQSNIIKIDVDSSDRERERDRNPSGSSIPKNIKIADITEAVLAKDPAYGLLHHPGMFLPGQQFIRYGQPPKGAGGQQQSGPPPPMIHHQPMGQEQIIATDQWKHNRRIQQQQQLQQAKEDIKNAGAHGRSTPDDRNIVRISQSPSPRAKTSYEPVSPPEAHYYQKQAANEKKMNQGGPQQQQQQDPGQPGSDEHAKNVLNFFNSKIAEAMRNSNDVNDHSNDGNKDGGIHVVKQFDRPRSGNGIPENDNDKASSGKRESPYNIGQQQRQLPPQAFMYPYNALTVTSGVNPPMISPKAASEIIDASRQQPVPTQHLEPRQVLSEQYDALSDED